MLPSDNEILPALRRVDVTAVTGPDGETYVVLNDILHVAPRPLAISAAGLIALAHLDGEHTCAEIQQLYLRQAGMQMPAEQILGLVRTLDEALLLQNERFDAAFDAFRATYANAAARDNRERYPAAAELRGELKRLLASGAATPVEDLRGLVAPHLDYNRGWPCYAAAYATLAAAEPAERYVILGTNHAGGSLEVVATRLPFQTPLGIVPTDTALLALLEARLGRTLCEREYEHAHEHSIELQVHLLQVISQGRPFKILPLLCPSPCLAEDVDCGREAERNIVAVADALAAELAGADGRTVVIAGADLSHVGQHFGDAEPTTPEFLKAVEQSDRALLGLLERRADGEFVSHLRETSNATRVCSSGCLYGLTRSLPGAEFNLLGYHQAVNLDDETHVTCAAAVLSG